MNTNFKLVIAAIALASSASAIAAHNPTETEIRGWDQQILSAAEKDAAGKANAAYESAKQDTADKVARADADREKGDANLQSQIDTTANHLNNVEAGLTTGLQNETKAQQATANHLANVEAGLTTGLQNETKNREDAEATINTNVDNVRNVANAAQTSANNANRTNTEQQTEIDANTAGVAHAQQTASNAQNTANDALTATGVNAGHIAENTSSINNLSHAFEGYQADANHRMDNMQDQINDNHKKANAGVATAMAAAGLPQVTGDQKFGIGAAVGGYESEQALAVGVSARVNDNVTLKASVGTDTQHGVGYNAGVLVGW